MDYLVPGAFRRDYTIGASGLGWGVGWGLIHVSGGILYDRCIDVWGGSGFYG